MSKILWTPAIKEPLVTGVLCWHKLWLVKNRQELQQILDRYKCSFGQYITDETHQRTYPIHPTPDYIVGVHWQVRYSVIRTLMERGFDCDDTDLIPF